jgi:hypothetical protein
MLNGGVGLAAASGRRLSSSLRTEGGRHPLKLQQELDRHALLAMTKKALAMCT